MSYRVLTECEWRKKAYNRKKKPKYYGAQYYFPHPRLRRAMRDRILQRFMLITVFGAALMLPVVCPLAVEETFETIKEMEGQRSIVPRAVSAIDYHMPRDIEYKQQIFTQEMLARGRMLLIDQEHPLPADVLPPNCFSVAKYGEGMVPVRSLTVKTGIDTIEALKKLFLKLRDQNVSGIYVWQGTVSQEEQKNTIVACARDRMKEIPVSLAIKAALEQSDLPGTGHFVQEHAVELRLVDADTKRLDERYLNETPQGEALLRLAWRYGLIQTSQERPFCFRYVGIPHATAMTYLNLDYQAYLTWLHEKGCIVIREGEKAKYMILCQPMNGNYIAFDLPVGCEYEASLDNTGYALVACTL